MTSREARARLAALGAPATRTHLVSGGSVGPDNHNMKVCSELFYHVHMQASLSLGSSPISSDTTCADSDTEARPGVT